MVNSGVDFAKLIGTEETHHEKFHVKSRTVSMSSEFDDDNEEDDGRTEGVEMEASSKGKVNGSVSLHYFRAGAHWSILVVVGILFLGVQLLASAADYWVSIW